MIQFEAEVKAAGASRVASGDKEIKVILLTPEERALDLEKFIATDTVMVRIYTLEEILMMEKQELIQKQMNQGTNEMPKT